MGLTSYAKEQIYSENTGVPKDQIHEVVRDGIRPYITVDIEMSEIFLR